jgi:acyl dehydratase
MMDAEQAFEFLDVLGADLAQVLHGEQRFTYRAPVMVGDTLRFEPRIASITDKKGGAMTLAVVETKVTNQHGVHVADCSRTVVVLNKVAA